MGLDEAGKGPVIGSMYIGAALIDDKNENILKDIGVDDSKKLSQEKREDIFSSLKRYLKRYKIKKVPVKQIDDAVNSQNSNLLKLEMAHFALLIDELKPDIVYIDAPTRNTEKFHDELKEKISDKSVRIVCENKADSKYLIVGASSILAKVKREEEISRLKKKHNVDFGSGYLSDPYTRMFLNENYDKYDFFRKSWAPWKVLNEKKSQLSLGDF